ncbi:unannotated protein [freshwater metagenome]|uniref:Unannotated protein n=1 Tax=freshwater metagenome TaxID=449393 RepID=A0A6J6KPF7_9ZZZZ
MPRIALTSFSGALTTSTNPDSVATRISPLKLVLARLCNPKIERLVTVLPEPDSPTIATVSPALKLKSIPSTALTSPSSVGKETLRFLISSNLLI